jgi:protein dithiol:quinone oxidoreductase
MHLNYSRLQWLGVLACFVGLAFAYYLQYVHELEPCPMCIFQRVAMLAAGLAFLLAAVHAPEGGAGRGVYALLTLAANAAGAGIAGRHVWLQSLPEDQVPACGPTLDYLIDVMPLAEVLATVLRGDGNCAVIDAAWMGVSLPGWTLVAFIGLGLWALLIPFLSRRDPLAL